MIPAPEALQRLRDGNRRFVAERSRGGPVSAEARRELVGDQKPFACILGCSDSRVPAELVFDQGLGDLFVIRVAGNVVAPSQAGSAEFAVEQLGTRLVVVLGHSGCGAVQATLQRLERPAALLSENLRAIVDRIRPVVTPLLGTDLRHDREALLREAVRANVRASAEQLRRVLGDAVVVGAEYELETGAVDFFDGI